MAQRIEVSCFLSAFAFMVLGCSSTAERELDHVSELATADVAATDVATVDEPPPPWETLTFMHRPEFQEGTGPVDSNQLPKFSATDSGLRYRVLRTSSGRQPSADDTVSVHYRGWLNSGKIFDSSYEKGQPTTFPLRNVIAGWTEGMQLVGEGGMIELWIPSRLGYGKRGSPGSIPPHSHLHFVVELIDVK